MIFIRSETMKEKTNAWQIAAAVLAVIFPLLYGMMYLQIWNGRELRIYNQTSLFILFFQGICLAVAVIRAIQLFFGLGSKLGYFYYLMCFLSGVILLFVGIFFWERIFDIPIFPPKSYSK